MSWVKSSWDAWSLGNWKLPTFDLCGALGSTSGVQGFFSTGDLGPAESPRELLPTWTMAWGSFDSARLSHVDLEVPLARRAAWGGPSCSVALVLVIGQKVPCWMLLKLSLLGHPRPRLVLIPCVI